jgi:hypothetical protein
MSADDIGGRVTTAGAVAAGTHDEPEERWPLPYTAVLVTASSVVIWALIIAAVRWVVG